MMIPDPPGKVQPDGRVVIGPDMSDEKGQSGFSVWAVVIPIALMLAIVLGFSSGRATAPAPEHVPFADRYVGRAVRVSEACAGDLSRYDRALIPIAKPLNASDAGAIKNQLEMMGYQNVTVEGVTYGGDYFYYADGCLP